MMEQVHFGHAFPSSDNADNAALCADKRPTALIVADDPDIFRLSRIIRKAGARRLAKAEIVSASDRLDRIVDVGLIIVHCTEPSAALADLLARLDMLSAIRETGLVVVADHGCLDLVHGVLTSYSAQLLSQPSDNELELAITIALRSRENRQSLHDIGRDSGEDEPSPIRMLREEIRRLSHLLDALMRSDDGFLRSLGGMETPPAPIDVRSLPDATAEGLEEGQLREMLRIRRMRDQFLPGDLFADPAWDMLLDLMAARLGGERVSVSSLCIAAAVPPTTALRWIRQLTDRGILERQADPADGRRVFIALSDEAAQAIARWFTAIRPSLGIAQGQTGA